VRRCGRQRVPENEGGIKVMNNMTDWAVKTAAAAILDMEEEENMLKYEQTRIERMILDNPWDMDVIQNCLMQMRLTGEHIGKQDGIIETCQTVGYSDPFTGPTGYTNAVKAECKRLGNLPGY